MSCQRCWGEGYIITCIDDLCRGADECMHGDGKTVCPDCKGFPDDFYDEEYEQETP